MLQEGFEEGRQEAGQRHQEVPGQPARVQGAEFREVAGGDPPAGRRRRGCVKAKGQLRVRASTCDDASVTRMVASELACSGLVGD